MPTNSVGRTERDGPCPVCDPLLGRAGESMFFRLARRGHCLPDRIERELKTKGPLQVSRSRLRDRMKPGLFDTPGFTR